MSLRKATDVWNGVVKEGNGTMNYSNYSGPTCKGFKINP